MNTTTSTCDLCGNEYDKAFHVIYANKKYTFDSFECAIQHLAPTCSHCGCRIIGHGMEVNNFFYCCAHCANAQGKAEFVDRVYSTPK